MSRRNWTAEEKTAILKECYVKGKSISDVCVRYGIHVNVFYRWQKELWSGAADIFRGEN